MKLNLLLSATLLLISLSAFSQIDTIKKRIDPVNIITQGDNERYWAQEIFDNKYQIQNFEKYKGTITVLNNNSFSYDGCIIMAGFINEDYKTVFEKGLIYPAIFSGYNDGRVLEVQKMPDSLHRDFSYIIIKKR